MSTNCILPFGRWYSFRNESSGRTARISVRALPIPKIDFIFGFMSMFFECGLQR